MEKLIDFFIVRFGTTVRTTGTGFETILWLIAEFAVMAGLMVILGKWMLK